MTRKLVTIRKVEEINPIGGADQIECVTIGGWQCVTKKGEFKVNDEGLYFEVDSFLPVKEPFLFLEKSCLKTMGGEKGLRLKTIRLRGQLSQGLLLPLSMFPNIDFSDKEKDYSKDIGVTKWEQPIPACLGGDIEGFFPTSLIPKTDQERIQNLSNWFEKYKNLEFEETEKLDGSSCTIYWDGEKFGVCSRNLELTESEHNSFWQIAKKYNLKEKMKELMPVAIQGELVGPGIQKNPLKLKEIDLYVFDIYAINEKRYLISNERIIMCRELGLKNVPLLNNHYPLRELNKISILEHVKGKSTFGNFNREGSVFKSIELVNGQTISFKCINNNYLLKQKDL